MGFFDRLRKHNLATSVRFKFQQLSTNVRQDWHVPKSEDLLIASQLCYVAHYFCIGDARHKPLMLDYLAKAFTKKVPFEPDSNGDYSHKEIWLQVFNVLSPLEQHATSQVFWAPTEPIYLNVDDSDREHFAEYVFEVKFINSTPIYFLTLGKYDKLLLPLSVSMFANYNLLQIGAHGVPRLSAATLHLLAAIRTGSVSILSVKRLLQSTFQFCGLRI